MSEDTTKSPTVGVRVSWEDKVTVADIQIVGGSTTVTRTGTIIAIMPIPMPNNPSVAVPAAVVAGDDKTWHMVAPFDQCKIL